MVWVIGGADTDKSVSWRSGLVVVSQSSRIGYDESTFFQQFEPDEQAMRFHDVFDVLHAPLVFSPRRRLSLFLIEFMLHAQLQCMSSKAAVEIAAQEVAVPFRIPPVLMLDEATSRHHGSLRPSVRVPTLLLALRAISSIIEIHIALAQRTCRYLLRRVAVNGVCKVAGVYTEANFYSEPVGARVIVRDGFIVRNALKRSPFGHVGL